MSEAKPTKAEVAADAAADKHADAPKKAAAIPVAPEPVAPKPAPPFVVTIALCENCHGPILEGGAGKQGYTFNPDSGKDRTGAYRHNDCAAAAVAAT